jgi:hypothetical protein
MEKFSSRETTEERKNAYRSARTRDFIGRPVRPVQIFISENFYAVEASTGGMVSSFTFVVERYALSPRL